MVDYGWVFIKNSLFRVNMNESQQEDKNKFFWADLIAISA